MKSDCTGCEIARIGSATLNYSDNIAVEFDASLDKEILESGDTGISDHESMTKKRPVEQLKLEDCIREFHQSEILDDENPWYCPSCCSNQRAHKSLSICRSPPTLMVYLKRFIFHDMMPIKVDDPVTYPLQLTVRDALKHSDDHHLNYNLEALVCHDGGLFFLFPFLLPVIHVLLIPVYTGVNAGHYTAYAKHCITGKWMYCNDSSVTLQEPSLNDDRAYILFYRRSGKSFSLTFRISITNRNSDQMSLWICPESL
jgi:ubiquitin carboxyl-terminal hydrolase 4/11/15